MRASSRGLQAGEQGGRKEAEGLEQDRGAAQQASASYYAVLRAGSRGGGAGPAVHQC